MLTYHAYDQWDPWEQISVKFQSSTISIQENNFEHDVCIMSAILFWPHCVNRIWSTSDVRSSTRSKGTMFGLRSFIIHVASSTITFGNSSDFSLGSNIYYLFVHGKLFHPRKWGTTKAELLRSTSNTHCAVSRISMYQAMKCKNISFLLLCYVLTHCGLVTTYGDRDQGQHWLRQSQRTHDAITSLWRQNVTTSFWCHNDVIIVSCAHGHALLR